MIKVACSQQGAVVSFVREIAPKMRKLSAEDLVRYQSDGVVHLKGAFDKEWLSKDPLMSGV